MLLASVFSRKRDTMVRVKDLQNDLRQVGCRVGLWGFTELEELARVLTPEEHIASVLNGVYDGGFAMLCVTDCRVLFIDKKPFLLTVEDLRYDMIAEVDYKAHIILASVEVITPTKNLIFKSWSRRRLHNAMGYIQQRLMEMRNRQSIMHHAIETAQMVGSTGAMPVSGPIREPFIELNAVDRSNPASIINPYTKAPVLSRRRRYPNFYAAG